MKPLEHTTKWWALESNDEALVCSNKKLTKIKWISFSRMQKIKELEMRTLERKLETMKQWTFSANNETWSFYAYKLLWRKVWSVVKALLNIAKVHGKYNSSSSWAIITPLILGRLLNVGKCFGVLTRSQVTGWDQVEGLTKSSCGIKTW
jgi:hypothetical protein